MKKMLLLAGVCLLTILACKKDEKDDCGPETLATTIVGTWVETPVLGVGDEVTFEANFNGHCTDDSLFSTEFNGTISNNFKWTLPVDTLLQLEYTNGLVLTYTVKDVRCDELILNLGGIGIQLKRKS